MNRVLQIWLATLAVYGLFAALLIYVLVPKGYDYGFLAPRPGWSVPSYQKRALPLAVAGYLVIAGGLTVAARRPSRSSTSFTPPTRRSGGR